MENSDEHTDEEGGTVPDIQKRVIPSSKLSDDKEVLMLVDKMAATNPSLKCSSLLMFYHLFVPVGQHIPGKSGG